MSIKMSLNLWLALLGASIFISLSPGAGAATAISYGLHRGIRGAAPAVVGLIAGYGSQILAVGLGLGAIVAASDTLFNLIKYLGAAYLIWLGIQMIREQTRLQYHTLTGVRRRTQFMRAYLVNITNPKGLVFIFALMPQFLDPNRPQTIQLLIIGTTLVLVDWIVMTGYSALASRLARILQGDSGRKWLARLSGSALVLAGLVLSTANL